MGIQVLSSILTHAGKKEGYDVKFCDKKGLAIRNGGIYSEITFCKGALQVSPLIPNGKADLLWGLDMLEAVRALDPKNHLRVGSSEHTSAFVNSFKTPTIRGLMGLDDFDTSALEKILQEYTKPESYFGFDFSTICEKIIGSKLFVNIVMMGAAYQKGLLPLSAKSLLSAVQDIIRADFKKNILAFNLGRRIILYPEEFMKNPKRETFQAMFEEKEKLLAQTWHGKKLSRQYRELLEGAHSQLTLDDASLRHFALSVYDLMRYENRDYAQKYVDRVLTVYHKDSVDFHHESTKAAIYYLPKVMLIKDEVYVSYLLTSPEKFKRDEERYQIDSKRGDRIHYRHINRPQFNILGLNIEFDIETRNWQLYLMKHCKFLRRLLPQWHRKEKEFRDWYMGIVDQFHFQDRDSYQLYLQALKVPEEVRGYRHIRYPKMQDARMRVSELLGTAPLKENSSKPSPRGKQNYSAGRIS
jgi:indolepyruvate ferredoxin oxidoreductase